MAIFSGILFTATNFFVKYLSIDAIEMLMVRSVLQTVLMASVIIITKRKFYPEKKLDKILVVLQVEYRTKFGTDKYQNNFCIVGVVF